MSAFVTARPYPGVSVYRRGRVSHTAVCALFLTRAASTQRGPRQPDSDAFSCSGFFGFCLTKLRCEVTLKSIEQHCLIGVDDPTRARDLDELRLVHFPRCTARR